ncbi:hypothetical protein [Edaphobacter modestus]|uniref:Outer membrane protein beta-barrel domain-containing protein n=1 Tax=Edaphobacter modestus TaxID=388466 RepID=A0A4Q7Y0F8_9BACT|nr:hypothetical protein [Edaphobacter modestus]RZU29039.1 hypothetical protein BDD14_6633 [Edaphobacter modestus]
MLGKSFVAASILALLAPLASAQSALPAAERRLNVQVGALFSLANPGIPRGSSIYYGSLYKGAGAYIDIDPHVRYGFEFAEHEVFGQYIHERTLEVGPRFHKQLGRYVPYGKLLYGRGIFSFPYGIGSLRFNELAFGGGTDYLLSPTIHVRIDYEYQRWLGFQSHVQGFPGALSPHIISVGVAYHIK